MKAEETLAKTNVLSKSSGKLFTIATSGGKDSLNALYVMKKLSEKYGFDIMALLINEGIRNYRELTIKPLIAVAKEFKIEYSIVSVKENFNFTIDDASKLFLEKKIEWKPCTVCGVIRRYLLNRFSRELHSHYLVTGHNLDDELQTTIMNIIRGDFQSFIRGGILVKADHPKLVPRIKPLHYIYEKESLIHALIMNFKTPFVECPYAPFSLRWNIREFINKIENNNPGLKINLLKKVDGLREKLKKYKLVKFTECKICGEPSAKEICKACELKMTIGKFIG